MKLKRTRITTVETSSVSITMVAVQPPVESDDSAGYRDWEFTVRPVESQNDKRPSSRWLAAKPTPQTGLLGLIQALKRRARLRIRKEKQ